MDMTSNIHDESILRELSKSHSSSRKDLLFEHVITDSKDRSCINAYKIKRDIEKITVKSPTHIRIVSTQPLGLLPEGKFNHCQGARISPITLTRSQHKVILSIIVNFLYYLKPFVVCAVIVIGYWSKVTEILQGGCSPPEVEFYRELSISL